ncbi:hypothetical protein PILCRDRAFT_810487 [Piloderma croceum F 1598]|uniref:DUF6534 domain-containing protein n=1 Tax=Piloderma croceum (strain F 1598) TaxID=765440 RepID=A0A0C3CRX1_PILCF|nr:hypothetical protein PILCRDRAFT_810487 [Piloderma croceum F 1598]
MASSLLFYSDNLDGDNTLDAKNAAHLVTETIGPLLVGFTISAALFGVTCAQSSLYFKRHSQDNMWLKSVVIALLFLETFHVALVTHAIFVYTIADRGSLNHLNDSVWSILIQVVPAALVVALVQYVWIVRIRTLSQSHKTRQFAVAMLFLIAVDAARSIAWMAAAFTSPRWGSVKGVQWSIVAAYSLRVFNDTCITGLLCCHLQRSKNGLRESDGMIHTMIGYGLRAGLLNCMCSVVLVVLLIIMPTKPYYVVVNIICSRVYANSLLAMLNWRTPLKPTERTSPNPNLGQVELSSAHWGLSMSQSSPSSHFAIPEIEKY